MYFWLKNLLIFILLLRTIPIENNSSSGGFPSCDDGMMAADTAVISLVRGWYCVVRMPHDAQVRRISWIVGSVG
jgi:hypothetical protein